MIIENIANSINSVNSIDLTSFFGIGFGMFAVFLLVVFVIAIGSLILKAYALWTAARRGEQGWFVALLLINTMGILELVYLYFVVGKWNSSKATQAGSATPNTASSSTNVPPSTPSHQ